MTESTRKKIIYAALVGAVIFGAYNFTIGKKKLTIPPTGSESTPSTVQAAVISASAAEIENRAARPWGRDPFGSGPAPVVHRIVQSSTVTPGAPRPTWVLSGVVYNEQHPLAFVNRKAVGVGDTIDQARVVKITKNKVTLEYNGNHFDIFVAKG
ncbi:MAG TPA: hypothetical protein VMS71_06580 [Candidatus Acidoferrum sp.]|nr:hypothetical protein [Candidatus Acidoferrum sp.]